MSGGGGPVGAIGAPIGALFDIGANRNESQAEQASHRLNEQWLREQAEFARQSTRRELIIHERDSNEFYGSQVSGISKGGLDLSGSPLLLLANTRMREFEQAQAIQEMGDQQVREASLKADQSKMMGQYARRSGQMREWAGYINFGTSVAGAFGGGSKGGKK